ncbi:MAG TPA: outer membrane beta-barrel protein [Chitinophagaceae bacterium]|nr:outer membrane beta-barrel protein [Chitinophagaceae bacterium]
MKNSMIGFISAALMTLSVTVSAQTARGDLMFGSQLANITGTFQNEGNEFNLSISPSIAYFFRNNFALGGMVDLGIDALKGAPTTFTYGIGPWARYYFSTPPELQFSKHAAFFLQAFVGFQGVSHNKGGGSTNGLGISVGPGLSYFITPNVSLDGSVNYNGVIGFGNATTVNKIGINLGFQIFLPTKKLEDRYKQESRTNG